MIALADTDRLVADEILSPDQAAEIEARSRAAMTSLAVNAVLCFGILAATGGLIFWLAAPLPVAVFGALALAIGLVILMRGGETLQIFGNAATLIGAGMLIGGASIELLDKAEQSAGWVLLIAGAAILGFAARGFARGPDGTGFALGAVLLMGLVTHLGGLAFLALHLEPAGLVRAAIHLYAAAVIAAAGWWVDVRFVTALAIVPFAQVLETGTAYWHAVYVFYSPESTLTIVQMSLFIALALWLSRNWHERDARHAKVSAVLAFIVLNLAALVGSLWGDTVGSEIWGPSATLDPDIPWEERRAAIDAWEATALKISAEVYAIGWGMLLVALIFWGAWAHQRGLFNTALTFGLLHTYTQLFESFGDEPLAYVLGGLAAVPLAWGMWRLNRRLSDRRAPTG
jgi:hypothetical protein